jgi:phage terminase large subunit-like protein
MTLGSTQMSQRLRAEGVPMHEFRATTQNFSPAIIELDAAMRSGRLRHDGNPVLEWCLGNVVGKADRRGNLYPTKSRPDHKIDAAVALIMALGPAMWWMRKHGPRGFPHQSNCMKMCSALPPWGLGDHLPRKTSWATRTGWQPVFDAAPTGSKYRTPWWQ